MEGAIEVLWSIGVCHAWDVEHQWGVLEDSCRRHTLIQGRGIDEGLEARAWLPTGLCRMVELGPVEIETADHGDDRAIARRQRYKCGLNIGNLCDLPVTGVIFTQADHIANAHNVLGASWLRADAFLIQTRRSPCVTRRPKGEIGATGAHNGEGAFGGRRDNHRFQSARRGQAQ